MALASTSRGSWLLAHYLELLSYLRYNRSHLIPFLLVQGKLNILFSFDPVQRLRNTDGVEWRGTEGFCFPSQEMRQMPAV